MIRNFTLCTKTDWLWLQLCLCVGRTARHAFAHDHAGHVSPSSAVTVVFGNANNPRLPPYPHPTVVCAAIQIRHSLAIPGIGSGPAGGSCSNSGGGVKTRIAAGQGATGLDSACVAACFAAGRGFFAGSPPSGVAGLNALSTLMPKYLTFLHVPLKKSCTLPHAGSEVERIDPHHFLAL